MDFTFEGLSSSVWSPPLVGTLIAERDLCGASANGGVIRFHDAATGPIGQEFVDGTFATVGLAADVFAYDRRAGQFAVTTHVDEAGAITATPQDPLVVALDPFDMSVTPWVPLPLFERALQTSSAEEPLNAWLFHAWRDSVGVGHLALDECAGATVLGFYGGHLTIDNLTRESMAVYAPFTDSRHTRGRRNRETRRRD